MRKGKMIGEQVFGKGQIVNWTYKKEPVLVLRKFKGFAQIFTPTKNFLVVKQKELKRLK